MLLRNSRARSPSDGRSSCAVRRSVLNITSSNAQSAKRSTNRGTPISLEQRTMGNWGRITWEAEELFRPQLVHKGSLGEMEQKRSYRRNTSVLALPGMKEGARIPTKARTVDNRVTSAPSGVQLKQARGTKTGNRIGYRHRLTLKNPARHRNPQCRVCQMPDFHKSLPTPDPCWGETRRSRREIKIARSNRRV